jgi:hypothetical protein
MTPPPSSPAPLPSEELATLERLATACRIAGGARWYHAYELAGDTDLPEDAEFIAACSPERIARLVAAVRDGGEEREAIMQEAFMTGRIYATRGEKENPMVIQAKLRENCEKAVRIARASTVPLTERIIPDADGAL